MYVVGTLQNPRVKAILMSTHNIQFHLHMLPHVLSVHLF